MPHLAHHRAHQRRIQVQRQAEIGLLRRGFEHPRRQRQLRRHQQIAHRIVLVALIAEEDLFAALRDDAEHRAGDAVRRLRRGERAVEVQALERLRSPALGCGARDALHQLFPERLHLSQAVFRSHFLRVHPHRLAPFPRCWGCASVRRHRQNPSQNFTAARYLDYSMPLPKFGHSYPVFAESFNK